jgi:hypothetical protein
MGQGARVVASVSPYEAAVVLERVFPGFTKPLPFSSHYVAFPCLDITGIIQSLHLLLPVVSNSSASLP